jgi:hypothetical protein
MGVNGLGDVLEREPYRAVRVIRDDLLRIVGMGLGRLSVSLTANSSPGPLSKYESMMLRMCSLRLSSLK